MKADAVIVAGGIGLAPLRGAVETLLDRVGLPMGPRQGRCARRCGGLRTSSSSGATSESWASSGAEVAITVDMAAEGWAGNVGAATQLVPNAGFDPSRAMALVCGPAGHDGLPSRRS